MDTKQQEQVQPEHEESDARKNQLLEIYKLHAQLAGDISNRQNTTSRFYATLISALLVVLLTFLQHKGGLFPEDPDGKIALTYSVLIIGFLGMLLSLIWALSITYHTLVSSRKYIILMKLESELEFQFFAQESELTQQEKDIPFRQLSKVETYIPYAFLILFGVLTLFGLGFYLERIIYLFKQIF